VAVTTFCPPSSCWRRRRAPRGRPGAGQTPKPVIAHSLRALWRASLPQVPDTRPDLVRRGHRLFSLFSNTFSGRFDFVFNFTTVQYTQRLPASEDGLIGGVCVLRFVFFVRNTIQNGEWRGVCGNLACAFNRARLTARWWCSRCSARR
jgi:hypothetical protein